MIRKIAILAGMALLSSTCVFAISDRTGQYDAGIQIGGLMPESGTMDAGVYFGGNLSYGINEWFAVGVEGGFADSREGFVINGSEREAHVTRIPLFADLIFRYNKPENDYVPYAILGLGGLFTNISGTGTFRDANYKLDIDNSFAVKMGAGVDWFVSEHWMLNVEASYIWASAEANVRSMSNESVLDSASMDYWTVLGGAKYLFD